MRILLIFILCLYSFIRLPAQVSNTWAEAELLGKGHIVLNYYDNFPFISGTNQTDIAGIECDLMLAFINFAKDSLGVTLTHSYKKAKTFKGLYELVKNSSQKNDFGLCAFSITAKRQREVQFTNSYMADYELIISSNNIPSQTNQEAFNKLFAGLTGLYIKGSTFEENIKILKGILPHLKTDTAISNLSIKTRLESEDNLFGYVELPAYLLDMKKGSKTMRQKFYKMQRNGYGIIAPIHSDWMRPMHIFFASPQFKIAMNRILKTHFGDDVNETIQSIINDGGANDLGKEVLLLNKEKEIQHLELLKKELQISQQAFQRNGLIAGILLAIVLVGIFYNRYQLKQKSNRLLFQANQKWEDLNHEKDQLLNIVAHDLRAPVNRIEGLLGLIKITSTWDAEQIQFSELIYKAIADSNQLIDDLLLIGKEENDALPLEKAPLALPSYLYSLQEAFQAQATEKEIKLIVDISPKVVSLPTHEPTLSRILGNLLTNSIKFSATQKNIWLRLSVQASQTMIQIQDEGQGFTPEDQQKAFQKFQKLSARPTAGESSTGLGLSIVKILVDKLDASIRLDSEWGKGSTFTLTFQNC